MQDQQPLASGAPGSTIGLAALSRIAFEGGDFQPIFNALLARVNANPADGCALMDISVILQMTGNREQGLAIQNQAVAMRRLYGRPHGRADGLRVLALMVAGDFMANTPLDFLLEGSNTDLQLLYVDEHGFGGQPIPDHDLLFVAIGESEENRAVLQALAPVLRNWPRPIYNGAVDRIAALTRDGVSGLFQDSRYVHAPSSVRLTREQVQELAAGGAVRAIPAGDYPIIVRPYGTHGGKGLSRIDAASELEAYLAEHAETLFYVSPFIDYRGPDGLYRKQRIALIEGRPFASHLAISEHWIVHYLSAAMRENADRRDEEAAFMTGFANGFARRHAAAFEELHRQIGLDYFVIDCAEGPDGRLLLFEADVAAIVHAMDPEDLFPYKKAAMRELFGAFLSSLERRARMSAAAAA